MRKTVSIVTLLMFVGFSSAQQVNENKQIPVQNKVEAKMTNLNRMKAELGLSDDQVENILAISEKYGQMKTSIRSTATISDLEGLAEQEQQEIRAILSKTQLEKYNELTERRRHQQSITENKLTK